jgi:uncharacterized protein YggE
MPRSVLFALGGIVVLVAVAVGAVLVADGDGGSSSVSNQPGGGDTTSSQNIRITKGLTVANLSQNGGAGLGGEESADGNMAATGGAGSAAPAADMGRSAQTGYGTGGAGGDTTSAQATTTDNTGITVQGYGAATADADSAIVEFSFSSSGSGGVTPLPFPEGESRSAESSSADPIDRETLQPIIDALVGAGVSEDDIEILGQGYYYDYYSSSATLRATVRDLAILDNAVEAAQDAAVAVDNLFLNSSNVVYTLQDCDALERAAAEAAVEDAADRAAVLADVLNVSLGDVAGASDYSWYNYGTGCGPDYYSPWPIAYSVWRPGTSGDGTVQVVSNISVTYAFS